MTGSTKSSESEPLQDSNQSLPKSGSEQDEGTVRISPASARRSNRAELIDGCLTAAARVSLVLFVSFFLYAMARGNHLRRQTPPSEIRIQGVCRSISVELDADTPLSVPARELKRTEIVATGAIAQWVGSLSLQREDSDQTEALTLTCAPRFPGDSTRVVADIPTRLDLMLPSASPVEISAPTPGTTQLHVSPFLSADLWAEFARDDDLVSPAMVVLPSNAQLSYTDSENTDHPLNRRSRLSIFPGTNWQPQTPLAVHLEPSSQEPVAEVQFTWAKQKVILPPRAFQLRPLNCVVEEVHLNAIDIGGTSKTDTLSIQQSILRAESANVAQSRLTVQIIAVGEEGIEFELTGKVAACQVPDGISPVELCPNRLEQIQSNPWRDENWLDYVLVVWWMQLFAAKVAWAIVGFSVGFVLAKMGIRQPKPLGVEE